MELNERGLKEYILRIGSRGIRHIRATDELKAKTSMLFCLFAGVSENALSGQPYEKRVQYMLHKYGDRVKVIGIEKNPVRSYPDDLAKATD